MEEGNFRYIATRIRFAEEEAAYYELALTGTEDLSDWKILIISDSLSMQGWRLWQMSK